jgi:hypothetical protein
MLKELSSSKQRLQPHAQREALRRSEKKAGSAQPENFKESETAKKIVEIGPGLYEAALKRTDPAGPRPLADPAASSSLGEEDPNAAMDDPAVRDAMQGEARALCR